MGGFSSSNYLIFASHENGTPLDLKVLSGKGPGNKALRQIAKTCSLKAQERIGMNTGIFLQFARSALVFYERIIPP